MSKEALWKLLEKQSNAYKYPQNSIYIGKLRMLSGDIFKKYGVKEFDYGSEYKTLASWLADSKNYKIAKDLVGKTTSLTNDYIYDDQIILGAFALALGNIIKVKDADDGYPIVLQFHPKGYGNGIDGFVSGFGYGLGSGDWIGTFVKNDGERKPLEKLRIPITIGRESFAATEAILHGDKGIETTARKMVDVTREYLNDNRFANERFKIEKWAKGILGSKGIYDRTKVLNTLSNVISDPKVVRYEKDPISIQDGKLQSHEWLVAPGRTLEAGVADCDDFSLLIGCLSGLMGLGVTYRIAGCDAKKPNSFSHVYPIISYPKESLDGIANSENVFVDIVYQKRIGDSAYSKEPKRFRYFDMKVI